MRIYFSENPPGIFGYVTSPLEIPEKISFYPWKFCKIVTPLGNSKVKNQDLWKFHMIFSWTPLEIPLLFSLTPGISTCSFFNTPWTGLAKLGGPARGTMAPPRFFKAKKKINNSNRNKLKIHNITSWIGQSICYYLNFIWFSLFVYVCKACAFFSCYYYRIQLFYLYKIW